MTVMIGQKTNGNVFPRGNKLAEICNDQFSNIQDTMIFLIIFPSHLYFHDKCRNYYYTHLNIHKYYPYLLKEEKAFILNLLHVHSNL